MQDGCSTFSASYVSVEDVLRGYAGMGLVSVNGADVIASGATAIRDPENPAHVLIVPATRKKFHKELANRARLLVPPTDSPEA